MTRSTTRSITTSLKINLGIMASACACLALTSARAVPNDSTADSPVLPGTMAYESGGVSSSPDASGEATSIVPPTGFEYAAGQYDGGDGGLGTWDTASVGIGDTDSRFGRHNDQNDNWQWRDRHCQSVPDGGSAAWLFGLGFLGLGLVGRYLPERKGAKV